jgi:hypothetical protein
MHLVQVRFEKGALLIRVEEETQSFDYEVIRHQSHVLALKDLLDYFLDC